MTVSTRLTAAEYLQLPETNKPMQLIHGQVIMTPAPVLKHQKIIFEISKLIERLRSDGSVFFSPVDVQLGEHNVVQPDVIWIAPDSGCKDVDGKYWQGAPDLVVEVLSASTARIDKGDKFKLYERYGVREYWLADPEADYVEVWQRVDDRFEQVGVFGPGETFESAALGEKVVNVSAIFEREEQRKSSQR